VGTACPFAIALLLPGTISAASMIAQRGGPWHIPQLHDFWQVECLKLSGRAVRTSENSILLGTSVNKGKRKGKEVNLALALTRRNCSNEA
jgi:hypothetical protein